MPRDNSHRLLPPSRRSRAISPFVIAPYAAALTRKRSSATSPTRARTIQGIVPAHGPIQGGRSLHRGERHVMQTRAAELPAALGIHSLTTGDSAYSLDGPSAVTSMP